ncbi:MAG: hypothetical protein WBX01_11425 [Nitrososphaeraceae archaeon]
MPYVSPSFVLTRTLESQIVLQSIFVVRTSSLVKYLPLKAHIPLRPSEYCSGHDIPFISYTTRYVPEYDPESQSSNRFV